MEAKLQKSKIIDAFDASAQEVAPHVVTLDDNMEYIFTAPSGHFFKVPSIVKDLKAYLKEHEEANSGQITQAEIDAIKSELLAKI